MGIKLQHDLTLCVEDRIPGNSLTVRELRPTGLPLAYRPSSVTTNNQNALSAEVEKEKDHARFKRGLDRQLE